MCYMPSYADVIRHYAIGCVIAEGRVDECGLPSIFVKLLQIRSLTHFRQPSRLLFNLLLSLLYILDTVGNVEVGLRTEKKGFYRK